MLPSPHSYFYIAGHQIPWYGVLFAVGMAVGGLASSIRSKKRGIEKFDSLCCAIYAGVGGLIGAKLFAWMTSLDAIVLLFQKLEFIVAFQYIMQGGFVFYGGLMGGFIGLVLYCKEFKLPVVDFLDTYAVSVPLGHVFGRIGCFMSGCCYGMPHEGFLSVTYLKGITAGVEAIGVPRLAVQLIEAFSLLILYVILELIFYKSKRKGICTCLYILGYSLIRFVLEYFRGDPARGFLLGMTTSQLISVIFVVSMLVVVLYNFHKNKYEKDRVGLTKALTSVTVGGVATLLSILLLILSTSQLKFGMFGANVTYIVMLFVLLSLMFNMGRRTFNQVKQLCEQGCGDEKVLKLSLAGTITSILGLVITFVSAVLLIVAVFTC